MKAPRFHYENNYERCAKDGKKWPCKTWRKWLKSPEHRIAKLEDDYAWLKQAYGRVSRELAEERERSRRNDMTIRGALLPWVQDIAKGVTDGMIKVKTDVDYQDVSSMGGATARLAARTNWKITYESSARTVVDGKTTEKR